MYLTRHETPSGPRWALDGQFLPEAFTLGLLLQLPASAIAGVLQAIPRSGPAAGALLAPLGIRHFEMPATPERLWRAIHERQEGRA